MKKFTIAFLILICSIVLFFTLRKNDSHRVLKILSCAEFYVDFNDNMVADIDELVSLDELDLEPESLDKVEIAQLNYLAQDFAKKNLLNMPVKIISYKNGNFDIEMPDGRNYKKTLIEKGYVSSSGNEQKVKQNIEYAETLNLVAYNPRSNKYHKLTCKYAFNSPFISIIKLSEIKNTSIPCKFCYLDYKISKKTKNKKINRFNKYPRDVYEKYEPIYRDVQTEFYVTDFTKFYYPSNKCLTTACKSLLNEIDSAKSTIDFAIYGIDNQPAITNALISAKRRGVKIRWVYDTDKKGETIYSETLKLKNILTDSKRDIDYSESSLQDKKPKDAIMHNKFFVFDGKRVWTGSANISHTDLSGFNANSAVLIKSDAVAKIYKDEFEQMFAGKFHTLKSQTPSNQSIVGLSKISVYFSPQDNIISNQILPLINKAENYIYVPVFVITHKGFNEALLNAKIRKVDVRIIVDATSAGSSYSAVKYLRENGIKVKTENKAGKMHMKSIIIDDKYVVVGSMNFTKSGEKYNDENVLIIENPKIAKSFKNKFLYFWQEIPDKWLFKNPGAESYNSINSCYDGIDNDFDGKVDMEDDSCNFKLKKQESFKK